MKIYAYSKLNENRKTKKIEVGYDLQPYEMFTFLYMYRTRLKISSNGG
jgi:hypothetical protein